MTTIDICICQGKEKYGSIFKGENFPIFYFILFLEKVKVTTVDSQKNMQEDQMIPEILVNTFSPEVEVHFD